MLGSPQVTGTGKLSKAGAGGWFQGGAGAHPGWPSNMLLTEPVQPKCHQKTMAIATLMVVIGFLSAIFVGESLNTVYL